MELINHNAAEKELRNVENDKALNRDKDLLSAAIIRENALKEIEEAEKL